MQEKSNLQTSEGWGCNKLTTEQCETCIFAEGKPKNDECLIYDRKTYGSRKPDNIYFKGAKCQYHNDGTDDTEEDE